MCLHVRKINKAKWLQLDIINGEDISADAITNCLKTSNNSLSVWKINSESEIDNAVLAIASGQEHLATIDVVLLNPDYLKQNGIKLKEAPNEAITALKSSKKMHFNIKNLTYKKLGIVAKQIIQNFKEDKVKRYTEGKIKEMLKNAISKKELDVNNLNENVKIKLDLFS